MLNPHAYVGLIAKPFHVKTKCLTKIMYQAELSVMKEKTQSKQYTDNNKQYIDNNKTNKKAIKTSVACLYQHLVHQELQFL